MTSHFFSLYEKGKPISLTLQLFLRLLLDTGRFFPLFLIAVPEVLAKVNWAQFPSRDDCLFSPLTELNREEKSLRHVAMVATTRCCFDPQILLPW